MLKTMLVLLVVTLILMIWERSSYRESIPSDDKIIFTTQIEYTDSSLDTLYIHSDNTPSLTTDGSIITMNGKETVVHAAFVRKIKIINSR